MKNIAQILAVMAAFLHPIKVQAALRLPALISDHMVLQAGESPALWGWADPGSNVTVSFLDDKGGEKARATAKADNDQRWALHFPMLKVAPTGSLIIETDKNEKKTVADVAVGEVWLGGGQSNMSYLVAAQNVAPATVAEAKAQASSVRPAIRFFMTANKGSDQPLDDVVGHWEIGTPETVGNCSAVAWYFGLALHEKLKTPVGLIVSAVGGTPAEAWMPRKELDALTVAPSIWKRHQDGIAKFTPEAMARFKSDDAAWKAANPTPELQAKNGRTRPKEPYSPENRYVPTRLYNGMVAGLEPYTVKGIIWFQADGNIAHPEEYSELIQGLIKTWRAHWNAELPFYYVEMNNMHPPQQKPDDDRPLSQIREAQNGALKLPRTGVVASLDLGIAENPHFPVKKPVGDRLANMALEEVYGLPMGEIHSPEFASYRIEGGKVRVKFKYAEGLRAREGAVRGFALQDASGKWIWAEGKVEGQELVLWSDQAPAPQALRYAWADNPIISMENAAGLPLRPFRISLKAGN